MNKKHSLIIYLKKIKLEETVKVNQSNYDIYFKNLLIKCRKDDIRGLVNKHLQKVKKTKKILRIFKIKLSLK